MIEIKGKYNTAKCFAATLEDGAREQLLAICDTEAFASAKIRIMPDVHAGKGCTIGTTMTITDKITPAMVGVDIGCGMYTVYLGKVDIDFEKVDEAAHYIPSGRGVCAPIPGIRGCSTTDTEGGIPSEKRWFSHPVRRGWKSVEY